MPAQAGEGHIGREVGHMSSFFYYRRSIDWRQIFFFVSAIFRTFYHFTCLWSGI